MSLFPWRAKPESAERRLADLRAELTDTTVQLSAAREAIGAAVADGDESTASGLRATIERFSRRAWELEAALPIAEARLASVQAREAEKRRVEELRRQNDLRERRLRAAASVDEALQALARAHAEYQRAAVGISVEVRAHLSQREKFALQAALYCATHELASALGVSRVPVQHWRPLARSEAGVLPNHPVPTTELETDHERTAV